MYQRLSRRSALRGAFGVCLGASWFLAGCTSDDDGIPETKTGEAKPAEESIAGKVRKKGGAPAAPAPTQRAKGGGPS